MKYIYIAIFALISSIGFAQTAEEKTVELTTENTNAFLNFFKDNMDYQVRAQFSIGGASPLGLPREIRTLDSYNPTLQLGLEANATKWITEDQKWGVRVGVRFEGKGMKTRARVKDYLTRIEQDNTELTGYYNGRVYTHVKNTYVTFPVSAVYKINQKWNVYGGIYLSGLIDKNFDGYVSDGQFRKDTPIGEAINFEGEARAPYDFSKEINRFQWGTQVGGEWKMNNHFKLFADMTYGFNGVLDKDFEAISFSMHNIYLNLGFGYKF
ncbi:porin family protein [Myroides phaeus]|uniref:porin family protein n=1 Tax=Myroides phaeus TaxID=702745 RepID=UPI001303F182|nr:porin family protein [Myroides phaeus]